MLQVSSSVHYLFQLVLTSCLDLFLNTIQKDPRFSKAMIQKGLEVILVDKNQRFDLNLLLVLLPGEQSLVFEKHGGKKDSFEASDFQYYKVVSALLHKIVVFYIKLIPIYIQYSCLKIFLLRLIRSLRDRSFGF